MKKMSRSAVELSIRCERCFVLSYKHRIRPPHIPFTLNLAVDNLCKNEFDFYRKKQEKHPLFIENNLDAIPFDHPDIDAWRSFKKGGIGFQDEEKGFKFYGLIDDVWIKPDGELIIADYKATSKKKFDWEYTHQQPWGEAYERQLEMYQWLFRKNGFDVANEAYLVYYNGLKHEEAFNNQLKFESYWIEVKGDDSWVESAIIYAKNLLEDNRFPKPSKTCEQCNYLRKRWNLSQGIS